MIIGMDIGIFVAWIGTILAALLCVAYGIYLLLTENYEPDSERVEGKSEAPTKDKKGGD